MSYTFRKAVRADTTVLIALAGPSGGGKTYSALRLARGIVGPRGKLAMIDTEAGRALHYSDQFDFDHLDLKPPFSPENYAKAVAAAEAAGYHAIIIDSMSHEWNGDGGCQDMHDAAHEKLGNTEQTNILAWRDAKLDHKRMMSRFLQTRSHVIFCLRAEEKIKFLKDPQTGKMKIEPVGWMPLCEKNFMYEMTASFMLLDDHPGVGRPIKLQEQMKPFFNPKNCIDEFAGEQLAKWAAGGTEKAAKDGAGQGLEAPAIPQQASDAPLPQPDIFVQSSAMADHELMIDESENLSKAQSAWQDVTADTRLTSQQKAELYQRYQRKCKTLSGKK